MRAPRPRPSIRCPVRVLALAALALCAACGGGSPPPAVELRVATDILYVERTGVEPGLTSLDVAYVAGAAGRPVLLYVHGGGWTIGDKANVNFKAQHFVDAGYVFVSVNYRLYPDAVFPAFAVDVAAAIAWTRNQIATYGGDGTRITLMGHSAGAHLVALVATDPAYLRPHGMAPSSLDAVIGLDTQAYDLAYLAELKGGALPLVYAAIFGTEAAGWALASPITGVQPGAGIPPMVVAYSGGSSQDQALSRRLSAEHFVAALDAAGISRQLVAAPEKSHAEINQEFGAPGDPVTAAVMAFLQGG